MALSSVVSAVSRTGFRKEVGLFRSGPRLEKVLWRLNGTRDGGPERGRHQIG